MENKSNVYVSPEGTIHCGNYLTSNFRQTPPVVGVRDQDFISSHPGVLNDLILRADSMLVREVLRAHLQREINSEDLLMIQKLWDYSNSFYFLFYGKEELGIVKINIKMDLNTSKNIIEFHPLKK